MATMEENIPALFMKGLSCMENRRMAMAWTISHECAFKVFALRGKQLFFAACFPHGGLTRQAYRYPVLMAASLTLNTSVHYQNHVQLVLRRHMISTRENVDIFDDITAMF